MATNLHPSSLLMKVLQRNQLPPGASWPCVTATILIKSYAGQLGVCKGSIKVSVNGTAPVLMQSNVTGDEYS